MNEWLPEIDVWREAGDRIAIATVVRANGSAPRPVGARLAVNEHGAMAGSVSGGCVENDVIVRALDVIESGNAELVHYGISDELAMSVGLACGGVIDVWIEPLAADAEMNEAFTRQREGESVALVTWLDGSGKHLVVAKPSWGTSGIVDWDGDQVYVELFPVPRKLVIFGAVHVAQPLSRYAQDVGYDVVMVDRREALATEERFPNIDNVLMQWPDDAYAALDIHESDAIVVLSHDEKFDDPAIIGALKTEAFYIGMIGSRRMNAIRLERLRGKGVTDEEIERLHSPIGLNIGGSSPEEMAISIIAEIIAVRNGRDGGYLKSGTGPIRGS